MRPRAIVSSVIFVVLLLGSLAGLQPLAAQENCKDTPEGRICTVTQPILNGAVVPVDLQRAMGLITLASPAGTCSGTLLNRYWVLTARHCVTTNGQIGTSLNPPNVITMTAAWAPGQTATASRIYEFAVNRVPNPSQDDALVYFGQTDLGPVNIQPLFLLFQPARTQYSLSDPEIPAAGTDYYKNWIGQRLTTNNIVTQYGRGFSTLASGSFPGPPPPVQATGLGTYRSAQLRPSAIGLTLYTLRLNLSTQAGHGGDSGGPSVVTAGGIGTGIAGVSSTCRASFVPGAPPLNPPAPFPGWQWATLIASCNYASIQLLAQEIADTIQETPNCQQPITCILGALENYENDDSDDTVLPAVMAGLERYETDDADDTSLAAVLARLSIDAPTARQ